MANFSSDTMTFIKICCPVLYSVYGLLPSASQPSVRVLVWIYVGLSIYLSDRRSIYWLLLDRLQSKT